MGTLYVNKLLPTSGNDIEVEATGLIKIKDTTTSSASQGGTIRLISDDGAAMADDHRLGALEFAGAEDASSTITVGAKIEAICDAGWSASENGAALLFYTTDANASQSEVLRLDSDKLATFAGTTLFSGNATFGVDDTGVDVRIYSATTNEGVLYDASEDELGLLLTTKLKFHDIGGGEEIYASSNGHLEINAGTTLDITAPTVDVNASTAVTIDTPSVTVTDTTTSSATEGAFLRLASNDGAAMGNGHRLGVIEFAGAEDASSTITVGARIEALCDSGWSASENGADLVFYTTDGNAAQAENMRIYSNSTLGVQIKNTTASGANQGGKLRLTCDDGAAMADDDQLGAIEFAGAEDSSSTITVGARIQAVCDAGWSASENGAALVMYTTDGNASESQVLRLDSNKLATFSGGITTTGNILPMSAGVPDIGSTSAEFGNIYLADAKKIQFGGSQVFTLGYDTNYSAPVLDTKSASLYFISSTETASKPELIFKSDNNNDNAGSLFFMKSRGWGGSANRAVNDDDPLGTITWGGDDGSSGTDIYADLYVLATDTTNNDECGTMYLRVKDDGSVRSVLTLGGRDVGNGPNYTEIKMDTATATSAGGGIDAVAPTIHVARVNGEIVTTILIDIGAGSIVSSTTAGDVIGENDTGAAYLTRITTAINGIVYRGEMACVEVPTTGDPDINLAANSASLAEDAAGEGEHVLVNGGTWTLGAKVDLTIPSGGIVNDYLYLTHGGTTAGTYDAGKYIIKLYGADF